MMIRMVDDGDDDSGSGGGGGGYDDVDDDDDDDDDVFDDDNDFFFFEECIDATKISSCRLNTTTRWGVKTARDFFWFYFSSVFQ